jgi:hypothetical protein
MFVNNFVRMKCVFGLLFPCSRIQLSTMVSKFSNFQIKQRHGNLAEIFISNLS